MIKNTTRDLTLNNAMFYLIYFNHFQVRENPHVTAEEWTWIKNINKGFDRQQETEYNKYNNRTSEHSSVRQRGGGQNSSLENDHQMSPTTNFLVGEGEEDFVQDAGWFIN